MSAKRPKKTAKTIDITIRTSDPTPAGLVAGTGTTLGADISDERCQ